MKEILGDLLSHFVNLDSKVPRTFLGLARAPGRLCRDYVEGKRVRYVQPLRYCLTILAAVILVNVLTGFDPSRIAARATLSPIQVEVQHIIGSFVALHLDLVLFAVLPIFILLVRGLFSKSGHTFAEVSAFVLYVMGQIMLFGLLLVPLRSMAPQWLIPLKFLLQIGLFTWAAVAFFRVSPWISLLKSALATLVYFILVVIVVLAFTIPKILPLFA